MSDKTTELPLTEITLDAELQPRAEINRGVLENYVQLLVDDVVFPPVTVFDDGETAWLADGFHRWHAHKILEREQITARVYDGTRRDALLYSLAANATHGLQRGATDYSRAYAIACRNNLVAPTDSEAVAALLRCSVAKAFELTERARHAAKAERDAAILAGREAGKSNREIARETGLDRRTVDRFQGGAKFQSGEMPHPPPAQLPPPPERPVWVKKLDTLASPPAQNWAAALRALREINQQVSIDELFADRFTGFDHAVEPELEAAFDWISDFHQRFAHERTQRRRA